MMIFLNKIFILSIVIFLEILFDFIIVSVIPQDKLYNIDNNCENLDIIDEFINLLNSPREINKGAIIFSIFILIISFVTCLLYLHFLYCKFAEHPRIKWTFYIFNIIKFVFSIIQWSLLVAIIAKINAIGNIGSNSKFLSEIEGKTVAVFILFNFIIAFYILEVVMFFKGDINFESIYEKDQTIKSLKELINGKVNYGSDENMTQKTQEIKITSKDPLDDKNNKTKNENNEITQLKDEIKEKDKEIKDLKTLYKLKKGEKLMALIFTSNPQNIHTAIICKNTDKFYKIEELLCEKDSKYNDAEIEFYINGNKIKKNKNLTQNKIKNGDIILFDVLED